MLASRDFCVVVPTVRLQPSSPHADWLRSGASQEVGETATLGRSHEATAARRSGNRTASWSSEPTSHEQLLSLSLSVSACVRAGEKKKWRAWRSFHGTLSTCVALNRQLKEKKTAVSSSRLKKLCTILQYSPGIGSSRSSFVGVDQHCFPGFFRLPMYPHAEQSELNTSCDPSGATRLLLSFTPLCFLPSAPRLLFASFVIVHFSPTPPTHPPPPSLLPPPPPPSPSSY